LGGVLELSYGKSLPKDKRSNTGYPVFGSNGIVGFHSKYLVEGPLIVVGRKGSNGEVHWYEESGYPIDTTYFVEKKINFCLKFIYYLLLTLNLKSLNRSTAIPGLNREDAYKLPIPLPPLEEQIRIADKIERMLDKINRAKQLIEEAKQTFELRRAAILEKALSGELTKRWREENLNLSDWKRVKLGDVLSLKSGNSLTQRNMVKGKYPVYGGNGIAGYHNEYNLDNETVIIGRVGYYCGSVHLVNEKVWVTDNALIVSFDKTEVNIYFLNFLLKYLKLGNYSKSTAQPVISGKSILPITTSLPSYEEQTIIAHYIKHLYTKESMILEKVDNFSHNIFELESSILLNSFKGK